MNKLLRTNVTADGQSLTGDDLLIRKITVRVVPFLFICYVVLFLDRINIGFAQLQMKHDFGFTDSMYGLGAAAFYAGYVLGELPSNMLLARFGARKTFSRIMMLCGIASAGMIFVSTPAAYYALRLMLGVLEAGSFPGILLYLTYWFPANRRAAIISVFIAGVALAGVLGGLFSGWIMRDMSGLFGLFGWQWMFALEGLPAIALGLVAWRTIVDSPAQAKWLSDAERARLNEMLEQSSSEKRTSIGLRSVIMNPKVYLFAFVYFSLTWASLTLNFWLPLIIRDFGVHDVVSISLLSAIPNAIGVVGLIAISRHSDKTNERRRHFSFCAIGGAAAFGALTLHLESLFVMLGCLSLACVLIYSALPIFWAVPSTQFPKQHAAPSIALISSIGITSGIINPWAIGIVRTRTGSMDDAIYVLMALLILSSIALLAGVRPADNEQRRSTA